MQTIVIAGNIGKNAEVRRTRDGDPICSFNVGVKQGYGNDATTNWFRCSLWGLRGEKLAQYLLKGVKVAVAGELSVGEYEGKTQLNVRVSEVDLMSRAEANGQRSGDTRRADPAPADDGFDDDIPF